MSQHSLEAMIGIEAQRILKPTEVLFQDKSVPLQDLLKLGQQTGKLTSAELSSHGKDKAYYGWQQVRLAGIPLDLARPKDLYTCKTGLEGYFFGEVHSQEQLAAEIMAIGKDIWSGINLTHRGLHQKKRGLRRTILGEECTLESALEWSTILGATLGRLRAKLLYNPAAAKFQFDVKQTVDGLPKIQYGTQDRASKLVQTYQLPIKDANAKIIPSPAATEEEMLHWETVQNLGLFGHPLVRALLGEIHRR